MFVIEIHLSKLIMSQTKFIKNLLCIMHNVKHLLCIVSFTFKIKTYKTDVNFTIPISQLGKLSHIEVK